jgi:pentatricopeptide repeat protein
MEERGIQPNVISYSAAISACEKGRQYQKALDLLSKMEERGIQLNVISYSAAIECLFAAGKFGRALSIVQSGQKAGHYPHFGISDLKWDLHGLTLAVACMLLVNSLMLLVLLGDDVSKDILIVTGQGHGSGEVRPVLQSEVPRFLRDRLGLEPSPVVGNAGRFVIKQAVLREWKRSKKEKIQQLQYMFHQNATF